MKDHIDTEKPPQGNCPKQLQTHKMPNDDVENINSTNKVKIYYTLTSH